MTATVELATARGELAELPVAFEGVAARVGIVAIRIGHVGSRLSGAYVAEVCDVVRSCLRDEDLVIPGKEGVLLVLGSAFGIDDAVRVADRVRRLLSDTATGGQRIVSAGAAVVTPGETVIEAMHRADRALGQAYAAGGNCTVARSVNGRRRAA